MAGSLIKRRMADASVVGKIIILHIRLSIPGFLHHASRNKIAKAKNKHTTLIGYNVHAGYKYGSQQ